MAKKILDSFMGKFDKSHRMHLSPRKCSSLASACPTKSALFALNLSTLY